VPLIEAGHEGRHQYSDAGPSYGPQRISPRREGLAPSSKCQNTQDAVTYDVSAFANVEVPVLKAHPIQAEEVMQQRIEDPAGVAGREHGGGFNGNDDEPENRGDPRRQKIVPVGVQTRALLDGIVGSLAGDHDVVDVTLAESGAADAHEARFLQEFGDCRAAAVAHA